jgi:peptide-methionine (S)-S-oxide reductase
LADQIDSLFRTAVTAIDTGDIPALKSVLAGAPALVGQRLHSPGPWLRDQVGDALEGFFRAPYLLWFVAEDPVRNGKLPPNIAEVASTIIDAARREGVAGLQEQLDYALRLVSWSWIARECGVQIALIDVLVDAGASTDETPDNALVNGNVAAAEHLLKRGAKPTLATSLGLHRWDDARRLARQSSPRDKQAAFILSALNGNATGIQIMLDAGAEINRPSADLYAHATALHHAVWSGSLSAVTTLVESGADVHARDTAENATPLGWAEYAESQSPPERAAHFAEIAAYLRAHL